MGSVSGFEKKEDLFTLVCVHEIVSNFNYILPFLFSSSWPEAKQYIQLLDARMEKKIRYFIVSVMSTYPFWLAFSAPNKEICHFRFGTGSIE